MITEGRIRELRAQNTYKMIFSPANGGEPETVEKLDSIAFARAIEQEVVKDVAFAARRTQANVLGAFQDLENELATNERDARNSRKGNMWTSPPSSGLAFASARRATEHYKNVAEAEFKKLGSLIQVSA